MNLGRKIIKSLAGIAFLCTLAAGIMLSSAARSYAAEDEALTGYAWQKVCDANAIYSFYYAGAGKLLATSGTTKNAVLVDTDTGSTTDFGYKIVGCYMLSEEKFFFVEKSGSSYYIRSCTNGVVSDRMACEIRPSRFAGKGNDVYVFYTELAKYDSASDAWQKINIDSSLPAASFYSGQLTSGYLYLAGEDSSGKAVLYRYNRSASTWENLSPDAVNPTGSATFSAQSMWVMDDDSVIMIVFGTGGYKNTVYSYKNGQWGEERTIGLNYNQYPGGTYVNGNSILGSGLLFSSDGLHYFFNGSKWITFSGPSDLGTVSRTNVCAGSDGSIYAYYYSSEYGDGIYKLVSAAAADETPPVITTSAADGTVTSSTYSFTVKAEDAVDGVVTPVVKLGGESGTALAGTAQGDGSYSYTAELAQGDNTIYIEASDESGNKATATFTITYAPGVADLTVTNISTPDNITAGTGVTVTATIENSGTANAGSFDVALYAGASPVETQNVASLAAGANIDVSFTWTPTAPGEITLKTVADSGNTITESNETNNELTKMVTVDEAQTEPDVSNDGQVNILDMILIGQKWGQTGSTGWIKEDVNRDGKIDVLDMILIGQHWTG